MPAARRADRPGSGARPRSSSGRVSDVVHVLRTRRRSAAGAQRRAPAAGARQPARGDAGPVVERGVAEQLLDEHPSSYEDIDRVMADQTDLVAVQHTLRHISSYEGV